MRALHSTGSDVIGLTSRVKVTIAVRRDHEAGRAVNKFSPKSMDVRCVKPPMPDSMLDSWLLLRENVLHFVRVLHAPGSAPVNWLLYRASEVSWVIEDHGTGRVWLRLLLFACKLVRPVIVVHSFGRGPVKLFVLIFLKGQGTGRKAQGSERARQ